MSLKKKIIIVSIMLTIFFITIFSIMIIKHKQKLEQEKITEDTHKYAVNEVTYQNDTELEEDSESVVTEKEINLGDNTITHAERLTYEQAADKMNMIDYINKCANDDKKDHGKIVSEEISDQSLPYRVFVNITFEDGYTAVYVCNYDYTKLHSFLNCITYDEWIDIESGANVG